YSTVVGAFVGEKPVNDVDVEVDVASGVVPTGILGLHLAPLRWLEIGASFRFGYTASSEGDVRSRISPGFVLDAVTSPNPAPGHLDIPMPAVLRAGARYIHHDSVGRERFDVEADFVWEQTSSLETFVLGTSVDIVNPEGAPLLPTIEDVPVPHHWKDTFSVRVGGSYRLHELGPIKELVLRAGGLWESSAMPAAFTRLDFLALERYGLTLGIGARFGRYRVDLAYAFLGHKSRSVGPDAGSEPCGFTPNATCGSQVKEIVPVAPSGVAEPVGNGEYEATIHLFSFGLGVVFDEV
ncbi:MAG: outer membrane protein transport protein, partial [Deltaproteobacteria bacterium]|nr:outer membrane protein transport protein [Deltaproteobacteria bacterium]